MRSKSKLRSVSKFHSFRLIFFSGFFHEQAREDRDSFVKINWDNIMDGKVIISFHVWSESNRAILVYIISTKKPLIYRKLN